MRRCSTRCGCASSWRAWTRRRRRTWSTGFGRGVRCTERLPPPCRTCRWSGPPSEGEGSSSSGVPSEPSGRTLRPLTISKTPACAPEARGVTSLEMVSDVIQVPTDDHSGSSGRDEFLVIPGPEPGTFALRGELDMHTVDMLRRELEPQIERGGPLDLDLSEVTFMDSSGL